ncbi:hypothetical protein [Tahibacter amnicola]|uniref:Uncharacterized protein n=1 Tax=Tahibacter amnicola TaxID=2976241 RepID=A0ABY6BKB0_9GAMM|nr:hypothetical protein [Tahibacter amnicola]UXI70209.1 hypothetical protein N4264_11420 [Tahibacter amnicola]
MPNRLARRLVLAMLGIVVSAVSGLFFLWPGWELARAVSDAHLGGPGPASQSWRWHRALSGALAEWAVERRQSGAAAKLSINNISGTEWPLFGTVFYLRATENLDRAWQASPVGERPAVYAREAIEAAVALVIDPAHATWVKQHWGDAYLERENVFYRMLLIDALTSYTNLTGDRRHDALLHTQVEGLSAEIAASTTGLLADYPGQIFPADVAAAWQAIRRADAILQTDHSASAATGVRGFIDGMAPSLGMPPLAWYGTPTPHPTDVRGSANVWLMQHAPELWPEQARQWWQIHTREFWQETFWFSGYREFARSHTGEHYVDIDSGPVIAGLGGSATAFGAAAARRVGAYREARVISLLVLAASVPLPNGRLLVPRLLSDATDAPLLGESAILYILTQPPAPAFSVSTSAATWRDIPAIVWLTLALQCTLGLAGIRYGLRWVRRALR